MITQIIGFNSCLDHLEKPFNSALSLKKMHTLWKHPAWHLHSHISQSLPSHHHLWSHQEMPNRESVLGPGDLDLWPMTLTFKHDLDILQTDLLAEIQVCTSVCSAVRVVSDRHTHTQRQTHKRCQNYYTRRWHRV